MKHRILVISDLHAPFHCERGLNDIIKFAKKHKPTHIVQVGDFYDLYAFSRFPKSINLSEMTAKQEVFSGRKVISDMWVKLKAAAPRSKRYMLLGNHILRAEKRILESVPELVGLVKIEELWQFKSVTVMEDDTQELIIEDIMFIHGFKSKIGDHLRYNQMNTVHGHTHKAGVYYLPIKNEALWELDAGHCISVNSVAASYLPQKTCNWTKSFGWIDKLGPRVILL